MTVCGYPDPMTHDELPEGFDEWRPPSGQCKHPDCADANRVARLYASERKVAGMTADEIASIRADHELVRDEYHGEWVQDHGGYLVVAEEAQ